MPEWSKKEAIQAVFAIARDKICEVIGRLVKLLKAVHLIGVDEPVPGPPRLVRQNAVLGGLIEGWLGSDDEQESDVPPRPVSRPDRLPA